MVRLWIVLGVALVVFTIYAIVDAALIERDRIRGLARGWWIVVILFVPLIGGVLWFVVGRGRRAAAVGGGRSSAPDDDPEFLRRLAADRATEERIRRLEQELAELDDESGPAAGPGASGGPSGPGVDRRRGRGDAEPGTEPGGGRPNA